MPNGIIKSFAKKSGKSVEEVEKIWNETKQQLIDNGEDENNESFYKKLVSILKKKLKINETFEQKLKMLFNEFISNSKK